MGELPSTPVTVPYNPDRRDCDSSQWGLQWLRMDSPKFLSSDRETCTEPFLSRRGCIGPRFTGRHPEVHSRLGLSLVPTTDSRFWLDDTNLADANDRQPQHHNIGTPLLNTDEGDTDGGQPRWEGTHTEDNVESEYSDVPESVAGEAVNSEEEEPTLVEDVAPSRAWMDSLRSDRASICFARGQRRNRRTR